MNPKEPENVSNEQEANTDTSTSKIMEKEQEIPITEGEPNLSNILVGLGWDAPETTGDGEEFDLDASAFFLNPEKKVDEDTDFIFYNNLETADGAIQHHGDNHDGKKDGDDETITVKLKDVPFSVASIVFAVTIHEGIERLQHFGLVENAYIRLVDIENNKELVRFNLTEDATDKDSLILGEFARDGMEWKFHTIGKTGTGGLYEVAKGYGVYVAPT